MNLKWEKGGMKTPRARVSGLGSAKSGVHHWMMQRITAIGSVPLVAWLGYSIYMHDFSSYVIFQGWLSEPVNAILMILFVLCTFYHSVLGVQTVVEDYIHNEGLKVFKLIGQKLFFTALGVACIFSIVKLALQ